MERVVFYDKDHSYWYKGRRLISGTSFVKMFEPEFPRDYYLDRGAAKELLGDKKYKQLRDKWKSYGRKVMTNEFIDYLLDNVDPLDFVSARTNLENSWDMKTEKACRKGTEYHLDRERASYENGIELNPFDEKEYTVYQKEPCPEGDNCSISENLYELPDGFYPELLVHCIKYKGLDIDLCGQSDKVFIGTQPNGVRYVDLDDYKGLALDTPIPTPSGWKTMEDIQVGDTIFDGKGFPTTVTNISQIHYNPCFKLKFDTNDEIICDHEHRWVVNLRDKVQRNRKSITLNTEFEMTTEEMFKYSQTEKGKKNKLRINVTEVRTNHVELPIDPYLLGLWLGDGNRNCGTITCVNQDIWDEIKRRGYSVSVNHNRNFEGKAETRTVFGIAPHLKKLNLIKNKFIPNIYLRSSIEQRLDLLRGLMDADGHFNKSRNRCVMITTSKWQVDGMHELLSSLGIKSTIIKAKTSGFGKKNIPTFHICFSPNINPFLIRNKDYLEHINIPAQLDKAKRRYITSIEQIDTVPTKCLTVSSSDCTYLAGKGFIKTHNTNSKLKTFALRDEDTGKPMTMLDPVSHLQSHHLTKYGLQLSLYGWFLEQHGFKVRNLGITHINELHKLPYYKKEIEAMVNFLPKKLG